MHSVKYPIRPQQPIMMFTLLATLPFLVSIAAQSDTVPFEFPDCAPCNEVGPIINECVKGMPKQDWSDLCFTLCEPANVAKAEECGQCAPNTNIQSETRSIPKMICQGREANSSSASASGTASDSSSTSAPSGSATSVVAGGNALSSSGSAGVATSSVASSSAASGSATASIDPSASASPSPTSGASAVSMGPLVAAFGLLVAAVL